jgi:capsular polysaccharide biosynthesis protein
MPSIYKLPLKERFEAASAEFATTFSRKARNARAGIETYSGSEFLEDLLKAAQENGLFPEALWAYFKVLHTSHQIDCSFAKGRSPGKRFGEDNPLRPRGTGSVGATRSEKALLLWGVVASLLVALCVVAHGLYQVPKYEAEARVLVGVKTKEAHPGIQPIPNATSGLQTLTLTAARAVPTTPVAQAVVEQLNLPKGSAGKVLGNMSVEQDPGTMLINVSYKDSDPKRAQQIANAIGDVASQKISGVKLGDTLITATLWKPATLPETPVSPKPVRNGLIALVATASLSLALLSAWAIVKARLRPPPATSTQQ